MAQIHQDKHQS